MSTDQFPHIFTPVRLGSLTLKHRVYITAHNSGMADGNDLPDARAVEYYRSRARGGAALLISGGSPVHKNSFSPSGKCWAAWDDRFPAALKKVTDAVHEHGVPFIQQIHHHGAYGISRRHELPMKSCSDSRFGRYRREAPHEMDAEEIQETVDAFATAAARARAGGADGVEMICGANGLIAEFISPQINQRTDHYGGSEENRLRFYTEVVRAVRRAVGDDFPIGIKVTGDDLQAGGMDLEDWTRVTPRMVAAGNVDYVSVFMGFVPSFVGWTLNVPPHFVPPGYNTYIAAALKEVLDVPVMLAGRVTELSTAEQLLSDGYADLIGMTRAHICDPDIINKARAGRVEDIRICMSCNMACVGRRERGTFVSCVQNPETGRLGVEWAPLEECSTVSPKRVMVIGGGVAGMEAARVAATRGHHVTLYERADGLGGQINIARRAPRRDELEMFITNKAREVKQAGVKVELNTEVTAELIEQVNPDVVVLATGASAYLPNDLPGVEGPGVVTAWDVLLGKVEAGNRVVVLDGDQEQQGLNVAEFLSDRGKKVDLITHSYFAGVGMFDQNSVPLLYSKLFGGGVNIVPNTWARRIDGRAVVLYNVYSEEEQRVEGVDTVVIAMGGRANGALSRALRDAGREFHVIGDAMAPRNMEYATLEGHTVGRAI